MGRLRPMQGVHSRLLRRRKNAFFAHPQGLRTSLWQCGIVISLNSSAQLVRTKVPNRFGSASCPCYCSWIDQGMSSKSLSRVQVPRDNAVAITRSSLSLNVAPWPKVHKT